MPLYKVLTSHQYFSGNPEDVSTNSVYFQTPEGTSLATALNDIEARLDTFWGQIGPYLSRVVTPPAAHKVYDMADPQPRIPVGLLTTSYGQPAGIPNMPEETAVVLSFQAPPVSGTPQARRRGRIYLGPLNANAFNQFTTAAYTIVKDTFRTTLATYAANMADTTVNSATWVVYSPTSGLAHPVESGWIDIQPDVQRRRGHEVSGRTLWTAP